MRVPSKTRPTKHEISRSSFAGFKDELKGLHVRPTASHASDPRFSKARGAVAGMSKQVHGRLVVGRHFRIELVKAQVFLGVSSEQAKSGGAMALTPNSSGSASSASASCRRY